MKNTLFLLLIILTALSGYFAGVNDTKQAQAKNCIEKSEYTDGDICQCLHENGLEDEQLCK